MKASFGFTLLIAIALGCSASNEHTVVTQADVDFDTAIEIIATSTDWDYVNSAQARLSYGGLPAIDALRNHLSDERVIPTGYSTRAINSGDVTIAEQALWTIQDMIETALPKVYDDSYYVLRDNNVEQWLDERRGQSLLDLQVDAAATQLAHAKQELDSGNNAARCAVRILEERLAELRDIN
jgi:hypothetical protein